MKVVINDCFGGFSLSNKAIARYNEITGRNRSNDYCDGREIKRDDPVLVQVVEELGKEANGNYANLVIIELPNEPGLKWHIADYDGSEHIAEDHRTWG